MLKVMLADDEPVILRGLRKLVPWEKYGLEIIGTANNGIDLLKKAKQQLPHIIISDISMPGLTGMDVIHQISRLNLPIKFIFISANSDPALIKAAEEFGAVDYLLKPIKKEKLDRAILRSVKKLQETC